MMKKYIGIIIAALSLGFESVVFHNLSEHARSITLIASFAFIVILFIVLFIQRKGINFVLSFISIFHNHVGSILGVFMILFLLVQIHLIGTSFHEYLKEGADSWVDAWVFLLLLLIPFCIQALFIPAKKTDKVPKEKRRLLITFLSLQTIRGKTDFNDEILKIYDDFFNSDFSLDKAIYNWQPIFQILKQYPKIEEIVLLKSNLLDNQLETYRRKKDHPSDLFKMTLDKHFPKIKYTPELVGDIDKFDSSYEIFKSIVERHCKRYDKNDGEQILFNISAGTSVATACQLFASIKSKRGIVYMKQDGSVELDDFTVNVYTIREHWDEILELLKN